ncbi:MAG: helicase-related protein [Candidatus Micrarchaeia archaeon]|jgi:Fanconi anemia group M protein
MSQNPPSLDGLALKKGAKIELRGYQSEAASNVLQKGNSLVVMPTALGKTFVAALVIAKMLAQQREGTRKDGKFLFLVPTKPLAVQQANRLGELLDVQEGDVEVVSGEVSPQERGGVWQSAKILVATPQTVSNDVLTRKMDLADFSLIVFDEAHRAVKDYAYSFIAQQAAKNPGTLLLGLTASPSSDEDKVAEVCSNLQVKHIEIKTEKDLDVADFVNKVRVDWVFVDLPPEFLELKKLLDEMLRDALQGLKQAGFIESADVRQVSKREILAARSKILQAVSDGDKAGYSAMSLQAKCLNLMHASEMLETQGAMSFSKFFHDATEKKEKSKALKEILSDFRTLKVRHLAAKLLEAKVDHPKKARLLELVKREAALGKTIIVFAHFRATTAALFSDLEKIPNVKPVQFVGRAGEGGLTQKEQGQILQDFREGKFNCLVSTSIGEEGLDVPSVDLVVFYEAVPSEIRYIQRRGRAGRMKAGNVVVLVAKGTRDEAYFWSSKAKERKMHAHLKAMKQMLSEKAGVPEAGSEGEGGEEKGQKKLGEF